MGDDKLIRVLGYLNILKVIALMQTYTFHTNHLYIFLETGKDMGFFDFIGETAGHFIKNKLFDSGQELIYRAKLEMWRFQKKLIKGIMAAFILLLAIAVLAIAVVFFLMDYAGIGRTLAFLIVGIVLLFIGVILKI